MWSNWYITKDVSLHFVPIYCVIAPLLRVESNYLTQNAVGPSCRLLQKNWNPTVRRRV
jgi:hypothetical protein